MEMPSAELSETTQLLRAWSEGDRSALDKLTPRVYGELRRIAGHLIKGEGQGRTMQATALVHEAYLRLIDVTSVDWRHRAHFFAVSAKIMRHILLDEARKRFSAKRGGGVEILNLDESICVGSDQAHEVIRLDDALTALQLIDARKVQVIEMRFFAGLTVKESAEVLQVSEDTVMRDWRLGRAWLMNELAVKDT